MVWEANSGTARLLLLFKIIVRRLFASPSKINSLVKDVGVRGALLLCMPRGPERGLHSMELLRSIGRHQRGLSVGLGDTAVTQDSREEPLSHGKSLCLPLCCAKQAPSDFFLHSIMGRKRVCFQW